MPFSAIVPIASGITVMTLRVLALNAYHGGSHRAFLEGWSSRSRHEFTTLTLPAGKWKWRMRHAAVTFAKILREPTTDPPYDAVFCTDMLNLAEFRGLCSRGVRDLPAVVYYHENQLTYPQQFEDERDLHFAFTNFTTALSADAVWFNSGFHRTEFLAALTDRLRRMPDFQPVNGVEDIAAKSRVCYPGVELIVPAAEHHPPSEPLQIVWVSRWEHDKDADTFFAALRMLKERGVELRLSVLGESFREIPPCFDRAKCDLGEHISHWGYAESREDYRRILRRADVVVSTALHEFFGIAIVEAVSAGCHPLVPNRLAYPEVLGGNPRYFHDGTPADLADRLHRMATPEELRTLRSTRAQTAQVATRFCWEDAATTLDDALQTVRL